MNFQSFYNKWNNPQLGFSNAFIQDQSGNITINPNTEIINELSNSQKMTIQAFVDSYLPTIDEKDIMLTYEKDTNNEVIDVKCTRLFNDFILFCQSLSSDFPKENKSLFIADIQAKINKLQKTLEFIENLK